jgi:hypothetical protein
MTSNAINNPNKNASLLHSLWNPSHHRLRCRSACASTKETSSTRRCDEHTGGRDDYVEETGGVASRTSVVEPTAAEAR